MDAKKIITAVLLIFVVVSVVYLLAIELSTKESDHGSPDQISAVTRSIEKDTPIDSALGDARSDNSKIVAYYFHRTRRCVTCTKLEQYSDEAIRQGFGDVMKTGRLEWKSVNIEEPANQHFEKDYKLYTQSLVLVRIVDGKQESWKNLEKIWELVGVKDIFIKYVQEELTTYLAEHS